MRKRKATSERALPPELHPSTRDSKHFLPPQELKPREPLKRISTTHPLSTSSKLKPGPSSAREIPSKTALSEPEGSKMRVLFGTSSTVGSTPSENERATARGRDQRGGEGGREVGFSIGSCFRALYRRRRRGRLARTPMQQAQ